MRSILHEFREFAMRGSMVDLAVGIIIGGAFAQVISSLVDDLMMPILGLLLVGRDLSRLKIELRPEEIEASGEIVRQAVVLNYGLFVQTAIQFVIIAASVFVVIKLMNALRRKEQAKEEEIKAGSKTEEELLTEIRDTLRTNYE